MRRSKPRTCFSSTTASTAITLERTYNFVERTGIETVRRETVYAPPEVRRALLDRLAKSKALSSDAWLERDEPNHPTQFVQIQPMETVNV
jgi:nitrite reductase (NADH) large subunit